jgi:aminoglycoside phosphotransferase (APT) family kinase protein
MSPLVSPTSSGFSNETLLFDLAWSEGGRAKSEKLVVRIQPIGYQVFPEYDLGLQFRTMQLLAPPTCRCRACSGSSPRTSRSSARRST